MAESIVARTINNVQSTLLDRLAVYPGRWQQHHQFDVVQHRAGTAAVARVVPLRVPEWAAAGLVRKHEFEDGSSALLWRVNGREPSGHLTLCGEGFEFTAVRASGGRGRRSTTATGWTLILPPEAPAGLADLLQ